MKYQVLAIDDSPSVRKLVKFVLGGRGFEVLLSTNGAEGLELLARNRIDAVVLDINMPEMDGIEFLRSIRGREEYASLPVIVLTTQGRDEDKKQALAAGATMYLVKPFKPGLLLRALEKVLEAHG